MKVHANARAQPEGASHGHAGGRAGVVAGGGRRGGRSQRAHLLEVGRALRGRGRGRLVDRSSAPRRSQPHPGRARRGDRGAAPAAVHGAEIAELLGDGALDGLGGSSSGSGWASSAGSAARAANRYERARPGELIHIDIKKLGRIRRRRTSRHRPPAASTPTDGATPQARRRRLGVRARRHRRLHPPRLRRSPRRRESRHRDRRSCAARVALLRPPRHHRRARDDRRMKVKWSGRLGLLCDSARWVRVTDEAKRRSWGLASLPRGFALRGPLRCAPRCRARTRFRRPGRPASR